MTLASQFGVLYPGPVTADGNVSLLIDATGEKAAFVFQCGKTGNIHKAHVRIGTVTSAQSLTGSLQNVDGSGDPDGVQDQSGTVAVPASNTWATFTMGADRAVTAGDLLSFVVEYTTTAGNLNVLAISAPGSGRFSNVYADLFTSSWAKQSRSACIVVEMDDGTIMPIPGNVPLVVTSADIASNGTPDEVALKFSLPFPAKCHGIWFYGRSSGDFSLVLYNSDGTSILGTYTHDKDVSSAAGADGTWIGTWADVSLTASTDYYAVLKPTTTTAVRVYYGDIGTAAHMATLPGGTAAIWSQRTDAGAWSDTSTRRPFIGVMLDAFDAGGGGGGGASPIGLGSPVIRAAI